MSPCCSFRAGVCVAVFVVSGTLGSAQAATAAAKNSTGTTAPGKKLPSKVTFHEAPSAEKPAERIKRLKRECKGRPNAGMCLGHTR